MRQTAPPPPPAFITAEEGQTDATVQRHSTFFISIWNNRGKGGLNAPQKSIKSRSETHTHTHICVLDPLTQTGCSASPPQPKASDSHLGSLAEESKINHEGKKW